MTLINSCTLLFIHWHGSEELPSLSICEAFSGLCFVRHLVCLLFCWLGMCWLVLQQVWPRETDFRFRFQIFKTSAISQMMAWVCHKQTSVELTYVVVCIQMLPHGICRTRSGACSRAQGSSAPSSVGKMAVERTGLYLMLCQGVIKQWFLP